MKKLKTKFKEFLKKKLDKDKIGDVRRFIIFIVCYGLVINYILFVLFKVSFNFYSFFAYGFLYYLIKEEFVEWFRKLFFKLR